MTTPLERLQPSLADPNVYQVTPSLAATFPNNPAARLQQSEVCERMQPTKTPPAETEPPDSYIASPPEARPL